MLTLLVSLTCAQADEATRNLPNVLEDVDESDGVQDICWVDETLYILSGDAVYRWTEGDAKAQHYWQQTGIGAYRDQEEIPEEEAERLLWRHAVSYLGTDGTALYAWQPFSGELFRVTENELVPVATVPRSMLTYEEDGWTVYRDRRQVTMQGGKLLLLLGTDDPYDWTKTSLICFDIRTQESAILSTACMEHVVPGDGGPWLVVTRDDAGKFDWKQMDAESGEMRPLDAAWEETPLADNAAFGFGSLLTCEMGQIIGYGLEGTRRVMAYVPVYGGGKLGCSPTGICAVAVHNDVFLRDLTRQTQQTVLRVMGDLSSSLLTQFSLENPDVAVVHVPQIMEEGIQLSALSAENSIDIYVVEAPGVYAQLKDKGYLAPLNASTALLKSASALYPAIQEVIGLGEALMAYPIALSVESWTLNQTLWDRFALGDVPETYGELLTLMERFQEDEAQANPEYVLVDLYGGMAGCIKLMVREYLLQCGDEEPDFTSEVFRAAMRDVLAHQEILEQDVDVYGMPLIYTCEQGFGVAYNDNEQTRMMLRPGLTDGDAQKLEGRLTLLTLSSACVQQEEALRLIAYCAEHLDEQTQYKMNPSLHEPVRRAEDEKRLAALREERARLDEQQTAGGERKDDEIQRVEEQIALLEEEWLISEESIANYRSIVQSLVIPYRSPFGENNGGMASLKAVVDAACAKPWSETALDAFLENLNRVARMVIEENE